MLFLELCSKTPLHGPQKTALKSTLSKSSTSKITQSTKKEKHLKLIIAKSWGF